jgi:ubiquinone biosynthesis protein Coq4
MGFAAKSLLAQRFEDDLGKPVERWRRDLNLVAEASFELRPEVEIRS